MYELDEIDRALLGFLQDDARVSNAELARRLELSGAGLQKRVRKLEDAGIIQQYTTILNREAIGYDMLCFIQVTLQRHDLNDIAQFKADIAGIPEVQECHFLTGEYDYMLKVLVRNRKHLEHFLMKTLTPLAGMDKIRTSVVLDEIKSTTSICLKTIRH
jgi:DNA-binding Lrp family transcriptional regulator